MVLGLGIGLGLGLGLGLELALYTSRCTYSWLGLGLGYRARVAAHTRGEHCTEKCAVRGLGRAFLYLSIYLQSRAQPRALLIATGSTFYAARACESRRAYSARCVRLVSAPHALLCDSLKLDTSRYLTHYSSSITQCSSSTRMDCGAQCNAPHQRFV